MLMFPPLGVGSTSQAGRPLGAECKNSRHSGRRSRYFSFRLRSQPVDATPQDLSKERVLSAAAVPDRHHERERDIRE